MGNDVELRTVWWDTHSAEENPRWCSGLGRKHRYIDRKSQAELNILFADLLNVHYKFMMCSMGDDFHELSMEKEHLINTIQSECERRGRIEVLKTIVSDNKLELVDDFGEVMFK